MGVRGEREEGGESWAKEGGGREGEGEVRVVQAAREGEEGEGRAEGVTVKEEGKGGEDWGVVEEGGWKE